MALLAPWETRNNRFTTQVIDSQNPFGSEVINFGLFVGDVVPLASPPTPASSCYPLCVDWRSTREMEEWKGVLGDVRWGAVQ